MNQSRARLVHEGKLGQGPLVYWMSRDQRINDNWALIFAQAKAIEMGRPLTVIFCLVDSFLNAGSKHFGFMLNGLNQVGRGLELKNIHFKILKGSPVEVIPTYLNFIDAALLVTDFDPLKIKREWKSAVVRQISIPMYEVDAHNIVPVWITSDKQEFAAYTIRPKINKLIGTYLDDFPEIIYHPIDAGPESEFTMSEFNFKDTNESVLSGEMAAHDRLIDFIRTGIDKYDLDRNNPTLDGQSGLSPYLHFGMISSQRVAIEVLKKQNNSDNNTKASIDAFLEELIIRKELSDNFCYYNPDYDNFEGFPTWAKDSLNKHRSDSRDYIYSIDEFENAKTHEKLWNAAQMEMFRTGKMHGYMRMYWAKKILEWSESPEIAMETAIYLNDKYEMDGRDPNGYAGIAWSIGGVHDRPWAERAVYGKIRYMNENGCKRKFDVQKYIAANISYDLF